MPATQGPTQGTDFWAALGIGQEPVPQADAAPPQDRRTEAAATGEDATGEPGTGPERRNERPADTARRAATKPKGDRAAGSAPPAKKAAPARRAAAGPATAGPEAKPSKAPDEWAAMFSTADMTPPGSASAGTPVEPPRAVGPAAGVPDPLSSLGGPRISGPLGGWRAFIELWEDEHVAEVHVRGTEVMVYGPRGVRPAPAFADVATARATVEAISAAQEETGATVTRAGGSVVIARRRGGDPTPDDLLATGVMTREQLARVDEALAATRSVTVTGPAAPVIVRTLASLVPAGSRVYEGPFGILPAGCVATTSPLDADYVVGVRPGAVAEEMVAAGQIGGLIANPAASFPAAVRLTVSGRSAALGKVTASADGP